MTSKAVADPNWGERNLKRRVRQQWAIKAAMVALGVAFVIGLRLLPPSGEAIRGAIAGGYVAVIAVLAWVLWRRNDEIQRRIAINAFAIMGLVCLLLMPLAGAVGPAIGVRQPFLVIYLVAVLAVPVAVVFQRLRG
jgi:hypothetical protein